MVYSTAFAIKSPRRAAFIMEDSSNLREKAREVASVLERAGHRALFAGGCVRDALRGVPPKDYDIATSATPEVVQTLFPKTIAGGAAFGVIVVLHEGNPFEVATFRSDGAYVDGRRPESVHFGSEEEDAERRDFTMNGLFMEPETGEIIDHVGGIEDLEAGRIRTIGSAADRFGEDRLRMLRAVRFHANLGFEIESDTLDAIRELAPTIRSVAAERVRDEILSILTGPAPHTGLECLRETGLLEQILPELLPMKGTEQPAEFHPEGDVWTHTLLMLEQLDRRSGVLALGVLLHDVGKPSTMTHEPGDRIRFNGHDRVGAKMAVEICDRLRMSRDEAQRVERLVAEHMHFMNVTQMKKSSLRRFLAKDHFDDHLELHRVDCLSSHRKLDNYDFCREKLAELGEEPALPPPLIGGDDLIAMGRKPGPEFSRILGEVQDAQLEGTIRTRQEALDWVRRSLEKD